MLLSFSFIFFLLISSSSSSSTACDRCVHQSKAAYFTDDSVLQSGACGYKSSALVLNGGYVAAAVSSIYKQGAGCGACFQVRCKNTELCTTHGVKLVVTDLNIHNQSDFVLSKKAFSAMAKQGKEQDVFKAGSPDIEYKRIVCDYKSKNLSIRVDESSQKPYYLAINLLYQGGQTEIVGVDVAPVGSSNWKSMNRRNGAVWDSSNVPNGGMHFRFVGNAGKSYSTEGVLLQDWTNGLTYDTGLKITDIAQESCSPCDDGGWI